VPIRAEKIDDEWIFSAHDKGLRIRAEDQATVFGLFKRLHGRDIPGTGIGLAICSKAVQTHGGRIWVNSEPGKGSEFFFSLPVVENPPVKGPN
jgi:signal transduction histidine kinase